MLVNSSTADGGRAEEGGCLLPPAGGAKLSSPLRSLCIQHVYELLQPILTDVDWSVSDPLWWCTGSNCRNMWTVSGLTPVHHTRIDMWWNFKAEELKKAAKLLRNEFTKSQSDLTWTLKQDFLTVFISSPQSTGETSAGSSLSAGTFPVELQKGNQSCNFGKPPLRGGLITEMFTCARLWL